MIASRETIAAVRFGYGFRPGEPPPSGPDAMLDGVRRGAARETGVSGMLAARIADYDEYLALKRERREGADNADAIARSVRVLDRRLAADADARIARAVLSPEGFHERIVWFWADHFTVAQRQKRAIASAPVFEIEAIRPHVAGRFSDLLRAAVLHPAMLFYLDQARSAGPRSPAGLKRRAGLNENLAREVLELHTLGVEADYRQRDVRQFAELLTGLSVERATGVGVFRAEMAEPGLEEVLGHAYGGGKARVGDIHAVLDDLAANPATARHVARKLAVHFVADAPPPDLVAHVEAAFTASGGELMAVYAALLDHPASWDSFGDKVRQPFDFVAASLRAAGPRGPEDLAALCAGDDGLDPVAALATMDQPLWRAPGPDGWPEAAEAWISAPGLTARIDWASRLGAALAPRVDPRDFLEAALGELARPGTRFAAGGAAERWEGIALVLAAPEFNRR